MGAPDSAAFVSDDFDRKNLDPARWTFVNPLGDGWVRMAGAGTGDANVELSVPSGPSHDPFHTNRSTRIMQPVADTNFVMVAKFESEPTERFQIQGFIVEADASNWIRFDLRHDGSALHLYSGVTVNDSTSQRIDVTVLPFEARYLRVSRSGNTWTLEHSANGSVYTVAGSYNHPLPVSSAGLFVANHLSSGVSPAFTTVVDWLEFGSAPLVNEDAQTPADVLPPFIHRVESLPSPGQLEVSWRTDELAEGRVEYGETELYEIGSVTGASNVFSHAVLLPGLVAGTTYHFRIYSTDDSMQESVTADVEVPFDPAGPDVELFYGDGQAFGSVGQPQPWVNVLGQVSDPNGVASLSYSLNGGPEIPLSIGPDNRRLELNGDFNVDMNVTNLLAGTNTLDISATDGGGNGSSEFYTFDYTPGTQWPLPVSIDWSTLVSDDEIQDVAQVVDGRWFLDGGGVRTAEPGYDRLIAIGDRTWTDYEFTVPVTRLATSGGHGVGVLLRWDGHTDDPVTCSQPKCGYNPLGAILWARSGRIEIYGNDDEIYAETPRSLTTGVTYWYKGRVESNPQGSFYSFKVWQDGLPEPIGWDIVGQAGPDDPQQGSMLLLAHDTDARFGNVSVTELAPPANFPPVANDDSALVLPGEAVEIVVLANDVDFDGTLDATSVVVVDLPDNGTAIPDPVTGSIVYTHDGSPTMSDSFTYRVDDALGAPSNIATVTVTITSDPPEAITSDDFNRSMLDTDLWTFESPLGDGSVAQVGAGSGDAYLTLSLPAGTPHDVWSVGGVNQSVRIMQNAPDVDFDLEVKWNAEPTGGFNDQGILIEQGPDDFLRFDVFHTGSSLQLFVGRTIGGSNSALRNASIPSGSALYLRVVRAGDSFTTYTSSDGQNWTQRHTFEQPLTVSKVGVFAANPIQGLAFTSEVDYFESNFSPITNEDANRIDVEIVGSGTVMLDPDMPSYAFGAIVDLIPVPAIGTTFIGWSGDLEGTDDPGQLMVTQSMRVTATFSALPPLVPGLGGAAGVAVGTLLAGFGIWTLRRSARMK